MNHRIFASLIWSNAELKRHGTENTSLQTETWLYVFGTEANKPGKVVSKKLLLLCLIKFIIQNLHAKWTKECSLPVVNLWKYAYLARESIYFRSTCVKQYVHIRSWISQNLTRILPSCHGELRRNITVLLFMFEIHWTASKKLNENSRQITIKLFALKLVAANTRPDVMCLGPCLCRLLA